MGLMLDSSVLIDAERGILDLRSRLGEAGDELVCITSVTAAELLHGVHRAKSRSRKQRRERFVEGILATLPVAEHGLEEARTHARLWAATASRGIMVGAQDLMIAAVALTAGFRLATSNVRDFRRVPGLKIEDWTSSG